MRMPPMPCRLLPDTPLEFKLRLSIFGRRNWEGTKPCRQAAAKSAADEVLLQPQN